jgi:outer membrane biogenesis lipoprotein LolB
MGMRKKCCLWLAVVLWISGCSTSARLPRQFVNIPDSPEVTEVLIHLRQENTELLTFKGTGKLKLWKNEKNHVVRAAWTGARPDKIRIVIQGITGVPVAGMAADGTWYYLLSYSQNSFYKAEVHNPDLEKLVSIPVTVEDVISLVSGAVPIRSYLSSELVRVSAESGYILSLIGENGIAVEKLHLDETRTHVQRIEMFTPKGLLAYRVDFNDEIESDGFRVPDRLVFSNDDGAGFQLDMDKFWPNAPVSSDMFVITP